MTTDYGYARTFFDIIMISPSCCLLLVPNVHIPVSLLSIFQRDTAGVTAHMAHFTGHIKAFGQGSRSLVLQRFFLQVRVTLEIQRTRETDQSKYRLRCSSKAELQPRLYMRNSCIALHVMVNSLCTSLNSFTDPTVCGLSIPHVTFHLRGSVRTVHKQRLTSANLR